MVAFSATDKTDAGIIDIECVSVKGNILPAEFGIVYSFQVANFSDTDIAQVPVTIYFNPQGSPWLNREAQQLPIFRQDILDIERTLEFTIMKFFPIKK